MSEHKQIAVYRPERFATPAEAALTAVRASGCTCDPEITIEGIHATIRHDAWCALLRREDTN